MKLTSLDNREANRGKHARNVVALIDIRADITHRHPSVGGSENRVLENRVVVPARISGEFDIVAANELLTFR